MRLLKTSFVLTLLLCLGACLLAVAAMADTGHILRKSLPQAFKSAGSQSRVLVSPFGRVDSNALDAGTLLQVTRGMRTFVTGYTYVDGNCNFIAQGTLTVTVPPVHGSADIVYQDITYQTGACAGHTYPSATAYYTWEDDSPLGTTDFFSLHYSVNGLGLDSSWSPELVAASLNIVTDSLSSAMRYVPYSQQLVATGSLGAPYVWSIVSGGPQGFSFSTDPQTSGLLISSGNPPAPTGIYNVTVMVSSDGTIPATKTLNLVVNLYDCSQFVTLDSPPAPPVLGKPFKVEEVRDAHGKPIAAIVRSGWDSQPGQWTRWWQQLGEKFGWGIALPNVVHYVKGSPLPTDGSFQYVMIQTIDFWLPQTVARYENDRSSQATSSPGTPPYLDGDPHITTFGDHDFILTDSPNLAVYGADGYGDSLIDFDARKDFVVYYGCHTSDDLSLDDSDARRRIRTVATLPWSIRWRGNYDGLSGKIILDPIASRVTPGTYTLFPAGAASAPTNRAGTTGTRVPGL